MELCRLKMVVQNHLHHRHHHWKVSSCVFARNSSGDNNKKIKIENGGFARTIVPPRYAVQQPKFPRCVPFPQNSWYLQTQPRYVVFPQTQPRCGPLPQPPPGYTSLRFAKPGPSYVVLFNLFGKTLFVIVFLGKNLLNCDYCDCQFVSKNQLMQHEIKHLTNKRSYKCYMCRKKCRTVESLSKHFLNCPKRKFHF